MVINILFFIPDLFAEKEKNDFPVIKLEWKGKPPSSYEDYIKKHPLKPAEFSMPIVSNKNYSLAILINASLYPKIEANVEQYVADLQNEGYSVYLQTVAGGTPGEIKAWIKERYKEGCNGVIFIGDITTAWAEVSNSVFPCDLFYMDLDGNWEDRDKDGIYEIHTAGSGDMAPEIYVARIYASTLSYDSEDNMVNDYLKKVHLYRKGELTQPRRGLEYIDEDWYNMDVFLCLVYGDNVSRYDYGYYTTAKDYLNKLEMGHHFVQVCAHSYSGGHYFSTRPTQAVVYAHAYIFSSSERNAKLLLGSDDGIKVWLNGENVYTNDRYGIWIKDSYSINVKLNKGWNRLLCKISQEGGDYKFSARFTDENLRNFNDIKYQFSDKNEGEFIRSWLINGFHQDKSDRFWEYLDTNYLGIDESIVNPNEGDIMGGKEWIRYDAYHAYVDMNDYFKENFGVCYAFVRIYSDENKSCQLWVGYDDGAKIWLNGKVIHYDNRYGKFEVDMAKINITLRKGENRLLIKISQWMEKQGFAARLCYADGSSVDGITYEPAQSSPSYIETWLFSKPFVNPDKERRLEEEYIDEANGMPNATWKKGAGNGCPFDIAHFYDNGDWVFSDDIQRVDPPVLFYNLFACGPGRFTDEDYLAGAYIFHTTYGLIAIASSKSGSMLNFDDFYQPLAEGKCIGEAFKEWFETQAPYQQWEKEWYYGMVICGDATLCVVPRGIDILKPENAIYIGNKEIAPFFIPLIIGKIDIIVNVRGNDIEKVEFYIDEELKAADHNLPYSWIWDEKYFFKFKHKIKVIAYDEKGATSDEVIVWKVL